MEISLFDPKSVALSEFLKVGRKYWTQFSSLTQTGGTQFTYRSGSCRGVVLKASYSSLTSASGSAEEEKFAVEKKSYEISGRNWSFFPGSVTVLDAFDDEYGGVVVDPERLPLNPQTFAQMLRFSLSHWKSKEKKGIWLKLPVDRSDLVPVAIQEGFGYHHAEPGYVMLTFWIPEGPSMLPANASHQVGVGGFVVNNNNEVLVVQEKYCAPSLADLWKIPTGFILESEEIFSGAVREVKEETGVDTEFVEVIAFRHAHNVAFEKSDLFFICMLRPLSNRIMVDDFEVQAAKWMPLSEFVDQPLIREDCMFKKVIDICIARMGKRYCGLSPRQVVSRFDDRTSTLYYNVVDPQEDMNCLGR